jgi:DNA-binding NtrC family response regulator
VRRFLTNHGFEVEEAGSCEEAKRVCAALGPDIAIVDYRLPDGDGVALLQGLKDDNPALLVVLLTAHGSIDLAVQAVKRGADHFLVKPVDLPALVMLIERLIEERRNRQRLQAQEPRPGRRARDPFVGSNSVIRRLALEAGRIAVTDGAVLILGETGTGKGVLARWIHDNGPRRREAFVDLNCAALSPELLESELFGHERGAFTGADRTKSGLLEVAHHGTVFLDEIGDMSIAIQPRLLKVLEEKRFRRLGDVRDRQVDVRLIAATHRDPAALIGEGKFREDLYYRISALPLTIPPLRERRDDILPLAETLLAALGGSRSQGAIQLSEEVRAELRDYDWPGNIRELRNVLERAALLCEGGLVRSRDLRLGSARPAAPATEGVPTLEEVEKGHIVAVLALEKGRVGRAAHRLGISQSSLYDRMRRFGIRPNADA